MRATEWMMADALGSPPHVPQEIDMTPQTGSTAVHRRQPRRRWAAALMAVGSFALISTSCGDDDDGNDDDIDIDVTTPDIDVTTPDIDVTAPDVDVTAPDVDAPDVDVDVDEEGDGDTTPSAP